MALVNFYNNSLNATSYSWDFGDGSTSTEANPVHTFVSPGAYVVRLTAIRGSVRSTARRVVTVRGGVEANFLATADLQIMTTNAGDQLVVT